MIVICLRDYPIFKFCLLKLLHIDLFLLLYQVIVENRNCVKLHVF